MGSNREVPERADEAIAGSILVRPDRKRAEAVQRLQIGSAGLGAMVLLIALANVIMERAELTERPAVPEAAATIEPTGNLPRNDPLAEAGVVPDMPAQGEEDAVQEPAIVPEQGNSAPAQ